MYYIIAFLEGFATLAVEIIAIRISNTIVGENIIGTSIFLGIILFALSLGYFVGGKVSKLGKEKLEYILAGFLCFSGVFYVSISFLLEENLLQNILTYSGNYIFTLFFVSTILFILPVLLASTAVPILTESIKSENKGEASGKILFWSTIGSFLGSVCTSILLFPIIGVHLSSILVGEILVITSIIYTFPKNKKLSGLFLLVGVLAAVVNITNSTQKYNFLYSFDTPYQNIRIAEVNSNKGKIRYFLSNYKFYSGIYSESKDSAFGYLDDVLDITRTIKPKKILVIGAAGFAYHYNVSKYDFVKEIVTIDIDPYVKEIAEKYFLEKKLPENIKFIPKAARLFMNQDKQKYDIIFMDAFLGTSIPQQLVSLEFFQQLKERSPKIMINFIGDENLESERGKNFMTTVKKVYGKIYIKKVEENQRITNFIVTNFELDGYEKINPQGKIYTDDLNKASLDYTQSYYNL